MACCEPKKNMRSVSNNGTDEESALLPPTRDDLDPNNMKEDESNWQKILFEVFLSRDENIAKYGFRDGYGEVELAKYNTLPEKSKAQIRAAFLASQTQENVTTQMKYENGNVDCCAANRGQGYWNLRAFYDCAFVCSTFRDDLAWTKKEGLLCKWIPIALPACYALLGIGVLKHWYPQPVYAIQGLFVAVLLYFYAKWLIHMVCYKGWRTYWSDVTVERTFPGSVRYFSIDYWSMVCGVLLWLIFDSTGGWKVLWVLATSAAPQLVYAIHCTFASTDKNLPLAIGYFVSAVAWVLLWLPSQSKWLVGAKLGSSYKGRGTFAKINENIYFMYISIMAVGVPLLIEFGAFLFMEQKWWAFALMPVVCYFTIRHIGFAALVMMGIATLTAHSGRSAYDPYHICLGDGWSGMWHAMTGGD